MLIITLYWSEQIIWNYTFFATKHKVNKYYKHLIHPNDCLSIWVDPAELYDGI